MPLVDMAGSIYAVFKYPWMSKRLAAKLGAQAPTNLDPKKWSVRFRSKETQTLCKLQDAWIVLISFDAIRANIAFDPLITVKVRQKN